MKTIEGFRVENIIGIPSLDVEVYPKLSLAWFPNYDILVFDPGQMVGWAGYAKDTVYDNGRVLGVVSYIEVGQGHWHECLDWKAKTVYIEMTPYAAVRTFDPWPIRFDGIVHSKLHPRSPLYVQNTDLKVGREWFKLPKGHGLGRHAKDALTHLVHVLVTKA